MDARVEVAERQHLEVLEQLARPARRSSSSVGTTTMVRALSGTPPRKSRRGSRRGGGEAGAQALDDGDGHLAGRQQQEERHPGQRPGRAAVLVRVGEAEAEQQGGQRARSPRGRPRWRGRRRSAAARRHEAGTVRHVGLEVGAAPADEVVADVDRAPGAAALGGLARALHGAQGHPQLALPGAVGQVLDRLAVAVAAQEVHAAVDAGRVALQHPLDEAHRLEVLAPVEGRAEAQAGDDVGDRDLRGRLAAGARRGSPPPRPSAGPRGGRRRRRGPPRGAGRTRAPAAAAAPRTPGGSPAGAAAAARARRRRSGRRRRRPPGAPRGRRCVSSARRRRFSMSASLSMLGQAHSSPIVSGATVW